MKFSRSLGFAFLVSCAGASLAACGGGDSATTEGSTSGASQAGGGGGTAGGANIGGSGGTTPQGGGSPMSSSSSSGGSEVYPAPHPAPHTVVDVGGPTQTAPKMVPVYFGDDDPTFVGQIDDFLSKVQSASYFAQAGAEYGVGAATILPAIRLPEGAPTTTSDTDIEQWLVSKIEAGDGVFPQPDIDTTYLLFYPSTTVIDDPGGLGTSCQSYGGYHFNTYLHDNSPVVYAVIPRCPTTQGISAMDLLTVTTSHEMLEAATDPIAGDDTAWGRIDDQHLYVEYVLLSEIGDQCSFAPSDDATFPGLPYSVQRVYSDTSALAGHDPCVPIPAGRVYFAAAPLPTDDVPLGNGESMKGMIMNVGDTASLDVVLFSDAPKEAWQVYPYDAEALYGRPPNLEFTLDHDHGQNGDQLHMSIHVLQKGQDGIEPYLMYSIATNGEMHVWPGFVYTQ